MKRVLRTGVLTDTHMRDSIFQVPCVKRGSDGWTLIELVVLVAILMTLFAIAVPIFARARDAAKTARTVVEIRQLEKEFTMYAAFNSKLPDTLADLELGNPLDPWGNPYEYFKFDSVGKGAKGKGGAGKGKMRKDRFLVPINTDYDLYSKGADGRSVAPLTAKHSWDDIIRANDGAYIGLASYY